MSLELQWKEEPLSPLYYEEVLDEDTLYQTTFEKYQVDKFETEFIACESKAEVASQILENLEKLMNLDDLIKEEPFLLDEKMLPLLDDVPHPQAIPVHSGNIKREYLKTPDTQFLLNEFENVYDVVEFAHGTLTPPQSPPQSSSSATTTTVQQSMFTTLEPLLTPQQQQQQFATIPEKQTAIIYSVPEKQLLSQGLGYRDVNFQMDYPSTPQPDIAHELAVVDEYVRTCAENMQLSSEPSSPRSSSSSNFGDCSSSDDPEWMPDQSNEADSQQMQLKAAGRKRSKPYSRGTQEDKKSRKKEQNKNAATRYRMKKKAEVEEILTEEKIMLQQNMELGTKITDMQREIKYLKGLMRDLFKAKGLIN